MVTGEGQSTSLSDQNIDHCLNQIEEDDWEEPQTMKKMKLEFVKIHIEKPQNFWQNVFWKKMRQNWENLATSHTSSLL